MNKVFRIVWNQATQTWQVVSELAKGRVKARTQRNKAVPLLAISATLSLISSAADAASVMNLEGNFSLVSGSGTLNSLVISSDTQKRDKLNTTAQQSILIGSNNTVNFSQAIAIGGDVINNGYGSIAIGGDDLANNLQHLGTNFGRFNITTRIAAAKTNENMTAGGYRETQTQNHGAIAIGQLAYAKGLGSTALGTATYTNGNGATALGLFSSAKAMNAVAVGTNATSTGQEALAMMTNANSSGVGSIAIGLNTTASQQSAVAIGNASAATAASANAIGFNATASGISSVALGSLTNATGFNAVALGNTSNSSGDRAVAIGVNANATAGNTVALGRSANATAANATAIGHLANATHTNTIAIGTNSSASGSASTALGINTVSSGAQSFAAMESAKALGQRSLAMGFNASSNGTGSIAFGTSSNASTVNAIAMGEGAKASGSNSLAMMRQANATASNAIAIGNLSQAIAGNATAIGYSANASATNSIAMGNASNVSVANSVAIGAGSTATVAPTTATSALTFNAANGMTIGATDSRVAPAGASPSSVFSVGNASNSRRITYVAAGHVNATSTDAINGSQLYKAITNSGFNTATNGVVISRVNNNDILNFVNGTYTRARVFKNTTTNLTNVTFDVNTQGLTNNNYGVVSTTGSSDGLVNATQVASAINNSGFLLRANNGTTTKVSPGTVVRLIEKGGTNITRTDNNITIGSWITNVTAGTGLTMQKEDRDSTNFTQNYTLGLSPEIITQINEAETTANNANTTANNANTTANQANTTANLANTTATTAQNTATYASELAEENYEKLNKGWNVTISQRANGNAQGATQHNVQMGDMVTFEAGKNINLTQDGSKINIATSENPTFTNVTANGMIKGGFGQFGALNVDNGVTIGGGNGGDVLYVEGSSDFEGEIRMHDNKITQLADGTADSDAVNFSQLKNNVTALNQAIENSGWNLSANGGEQEHIANNGTVNFVEGKNINITHDGKGNVTVKTVDSPSFEVVTATEVNTTNITATNGNITNLTAENVNATNVNATDVNTTNITATNGNITNFTAENVNATNVNATDVNTTNITATNGNITTLNSTTINNTGAINTDTLTTVANATIGGMLTANGGLTVGANQTVSMGGNRIQDVQAAKNGTDAVNLDQLNSTIANSGWNLSANGGEQEHIANNGTVNFVEGQNINITHDGKGNVTVKTVDSPVFEMVTAKDVNTTNITATNGNITNLTAENVNATNVNATDVNTTNITATNGNITNLTAENVNATNVNATDVNTTNITATNGNITNLTAKNVNATNVNATDVNTTNITATNGNITNLTAENVNATNVNATDVNTTNITATNGNITTLNSTTINNAGAINTDTLTTIANATIGGMLTANGGLTVGANQTVSMGGNRIQDVQAAKNGTDAVNLDQLNSTIANSGWNLSANGGEQEHIENNGTVNFVEGQNINITHDGKGNVTVKTVDSPSFEVVTAKDVNTTNITATNGNITNLTAENVNATNVNATDVNTTNITATNGNITNLTAENVNATNVNATDVNTTNITATNGNITNLTAENVNATNVNATDVNTTNITATNGNITNLTAENVNATNVNATEVNTTNITATNGNITNLTAENVNATNVNVTDVNTTNITATNGNITTLNSTTINNAGAINTDTLTTIANATIGGMLTANGGLTVGANQTVSMGGNRIQDVQAAKNGTDAVNLDQLNSTIANSGWNLSANGGEQEHIANNGTVNFVEGQNINITHDGKGNVTVKTVDSPSFEMVTAKDVNTINITATNGNITNLTAENVNATNVNATDVNTINITATNGNITNLTAENVNATNVNATDVNTTNITATNGNITNLTAENVNATNVNATDVNATNITATNGNITTLNSTMINNAGAINTDTLTTIANATIGGMLTANGGLTVGANQTVSMGGNRIQDVQAAKNGTDAVNLDQLNSTIANSGWNLSANGREQEHIANNGTVNFVEGQNINITHDGKGNVTVKTVDSPSFEVVTATEVNTTNITATNGNITTLNSTTINNAGAINTDTLTTIANATIGGMLTANGGLTVGANQTVSMGGNRIQDVQAAKNGTDAVNLDQLNSTIANSGWNLSANGREQEHIANNGTVNFVEGQNINITHDGKGNVTVKTVDSPSFEVVTAKDVNTTNITATNGNITNLTAENVNATNVNATEVNTTNITATNGNITTLNSTTINNAGAINTDTLTTIANATIGGMLTANGGLTVGANQTVSMGGNRIQDVQAAKNGTDAVNLDQLNSTIANSGWNLSANGGEQEHIANNGTVNFVEGQNINITHDGKGNVTVKTVDSPVFEMVTAKDVNTTNITATNGNITNLTAENVNATNVNATDVNTTNITATNGNITNLTAENVNATNVNATDVNTTNITATNGNITTLNSTTINNAGAINTNTLITSGAATIGGMLTANGGLTVTNGGFSVSSGQAVDFGGNVVNGVGRPTQDSSAVNLAYLNSTVLDLVKQINDSGWNLSANGGAQEHIANNGTVNFVEGKNINITHDGKGNVTVKTVDSPSFEMVTVTDVNTTNITATNGNITHLNATNVNTTNIIATNGEITSLNSSTINNSGAINTKILTVSENATIAGMLNAQGGLTIGANQTVDMGGNVISNVAKGVKETDAVNVAQLNATVNQATEALTNLGLNVSGNSGETSIKLGSTLPIVGSLAENKEASSKNIRTQVSANGVEILLNDNPEFNNVTATNLAVNGDTTLNGNTTVGGNGAVLTVVENTTVNMGNNVISGVAAGDISPVSTDAVNGAQLYAVNSLLSGDLNVTKSGEQLIATDKDGNVYTLTTYNVNGQTEYVTNSVVTAIHNMNEQGIKFFHTNDGKVQPVAQNSNNIDASASGAYSTAVGYQAVAEGESAVAMGKASQATGYQAVAIGTENAVAGNSAGAFGTTNTVEGNDSYAYGNNNHIDSSAQGSVVVGNNNNVQTEDTYVLGSNVQHTAANSVFLGNDSGYVEAGATTMGNQAYEGVTLLGQHYQFAGGAANQVVGVVSVGNVDENGVQQTRRIQNVAPGLISPSSTDAINGSQLYQALGSMNYNVNQLNHKVDRIDRNLRSGIAGAVAIGSLVQAYNPSDSILAIGGGTYRGASAVALGYSKVSDNGKIILKVTGSLDNSGHYSGGASIGYKF